MAILPIDRVEILGVVVWTQLGCAVFFDLLQIRVMR